MLINRGGKGTLGSVFSPRSALTQTHICILVTVVTQSLPFCIRWSKYHFFWNILFLKLILCELYLMDVLINRCSNLLFGQFWFVLSILETNVSSTNHMKSLEDPVMSHELKTSSIWYSTKRDNNTHWKEESILTKRWEKAGGSYAEKWSKACIDTLLKQ